MKFVLTRTSESKPIGWVDIDTIDELMQLIKREEHSVIVSDEDEYHKRNIEIYDEKKKKKMKAFNLYFFSGEAGGTWWESTVYAKTLKQAKQMVANLYYVDVKRVFET